MEFVLLLSGEEDYSYQLAFGCYEIGASYADWNAELLSVFLVFGHFFLIAHLYYRCPLVYKRIFVYFVGSSMHASQPVCFFDHRHRLPGQSTFIDKCTSLEDNPLERYLDGIFQENHISRNNIDRRYLFDNSISQSTDGNLVIGHCKYFVVELYHLVEIDDDSYDEYYQ